MTGASPSLSMCNLGTPGVFACISGSLIVSGPTALVPLARTYQGRCGIGNSSLFAEKTTRADLGDHHVAIVLLRV
jgi:hypothetical protein